MISTYGFYGFRGSRSDNRFDFPKPPPFLKTFSLSIAGDFGFSRIITGLKKILEGIAHCKYGSIFK